jgi:hypothetical protein
MEEVAINRRKDIMLPGLVISKFIAHKFQRLTLVLGPPFSIQGTEKCGQRLSERFILFILLWTKDILICHSDILHLPLPL